jgi:hypothetical protein
MSDDTLKDKIAGLLCVKAGWAFGVPEDGREDWLNMVVAAVRDHHATVRSE